MSAVTFDMSMSLDGYVRAANPRPEEPLGDGGEALHAWAMNDDAVGREVLDRGVAGTGAVICGRVTYDDSLPWWGADGPTGSARLPVFVLTHTAPFDAPGGGVYVFVTTGIEDALAQAQEAANGTNVTIMGGPAVGNQFLRAGLVHELSIHLVPVLFGAGTQLTKTLPAHIALEPTDHLVLLERRGFLAMLAARLMPGVPATGLHYAAGVGPVGVPAFAAGMALGALVRTAPYAVLGQGIGWGRSPRS